MARGRFPPWRRGSGWYWLSKDGLLGGSPRCLCIHIWLYLMAIYVYGLVVVVSLAVVPLRAPCGGGDCRKGGEVRRFLVNASPDLQAYKSQQ